MNKLQAAAQFRRALQLFAVTLDEEAALEAAGVYPAWVPGRTYFVGDYLTYGVNGVGDPQLYKVAQVHTSQTDWLPDELPALYTPVGLNEEGYPVWSKPTGAHDAYSAGGHRGLSGEVVPMHGRRQRVEPGGLSSRRGAFIIFINS